MRVSLEVPVDWLLTILKHIVNLAQARGNKWQYRGIFMFQVVHKYCRVSHRGCIFSVCNLNKIVLVCFQISDEWISFNVHQEAVNKILKIMTQDL